MLTANKRLSDEVKSSSSTSSSALRPVKVILRIRPRHHFEKPSCILLENQNSIRIPNPRNPNEYLNYKFDRCYGEESTQEDLFETDVKPSLDQLFAGINTCIFAYGVTGAGKTFTITGSEEKPGIIPNAMKYLLSQSQFFDECNITISFFEIYCEDVWDLLVPRQLQTTSLKIREDQNKNILIAGLKEVPIKEFRDFGEVFKTATKNRSTAATNLNAHSSRSHSVMRIQLATRDGDKITSSKMYILDLAGAENNKKTGNKGKERMAESGAINKSLFVLGNVVDALNSKAHRIPYRDSKMTRILQDSLGGNSLAMMIANIASSENYYTDIYQTLNFASKSKKIVNQPVVNESTAFLGRRVSNESATSASTAIERKIETKAGPKRVLESQPAGPRPPMKKRKVAEDVVTAEQLVAFKRELLETVEEQLHSTTKGLISPILRKQQPWVSSETQVRLEKLEKRIETRLQVDKDVLLEMSPATQMKVAKGFLVKARQYEAQGDTEKAQESYQRAHPLLPEKSQKIEKKIQKLQKISQDGSGGNPSSSLSKCSTSIMSASLLMATQYDQLLPPEESFNVPKASSKVKPTADSSIAETRPDKNDSHRGQTLETSTLLSSSNLSSTAYSSIPNSLSTSNPPSFKLNTVDIPQNLEYDLNVDLPPQPQPKKRKRADITDIF
ncbi:P-loop containing nucleoside triphosphate hydrolase protein, partial [Paraphysoderma sedebokerense]